MSHYKLRSGHRVVVDGEEVLDVSQSVLLVSSVEDELRNRRAHRYHRRWQSRSGAVEAPGQIEV